jgi:uncharacterized protein YggE
MGNDLFKWVVLALSLVLLAAGLYLLRPSEERLTRVTVVGNSEAKIAPNTAVVNFSVVTESPQAVTAQQDNARKSEAVQKAVEALSSDAKIDVKTSNYTLQPEYSYDRSPPRIKGYSVRNTVNVSIDKLERVGDVIDAATAAGANSVEGIQFVVGQESPAQGEALALASKQAMAKAEAIATAMNGQIVRVVQSTEGGIDPEHVRASYENDGYAARSAVIANRATPIKAGSVDVRSQVILVVDIAIRPKP